MIGFYEEAQDFVSYLTPEERSYVFQNLSEILQLCHSTQTKPIAREKKTIFFVKPDTNYQQLFQCKNNRNEEIIVRKVSQSSFFQQRSYIEVFLNFKEIPVDFIYNIAEILQQELFA